VDEIWAHSFATAIGPAALAFGPHGLIAVALPAQTEAATRRGLEAVVTRRHLGSKGTVGTLWIDAPRGPMAEATSELRRALGGQAVDLTGIELDLRNLSSFACLVYREAQRIPRGEVRTYGELAARVGRPTAARAVGSAMAHNPFVVVVPCHRVVGGRGDLHGFSAPGGLRTKAALLAMEATDVASSTAPGDEGEPPSRTMPAAAPKRIRAQEPSAAQAGLPFERH
jgi:methylated-DNA-[protein]-cysteine S-methyltransferase